MENSGNNFDQSGWLTIASVAAVIWSQMSMDNSQQDAGLHWVVSRK